MFYNVTMKIKSRVLMVMILTGMLLLTLIGSLNLDKNEKPEEEPVEESQNQETQVPVSFKGAVKDEYGVPSQVMKVITDYMDAYYRSVYTLEVCDFSPYFDNELMTRICDRAVTMVVESRKDYDFDFTMNKAHYDLEIIDYENSGNEYKISVLEDDYMSFAFLDGIESQTFDVENYFTIVSTDDGYKIRDLDKVQGYYATYYDAESVEEVNETYDFYIKQLKDMHAYNNEVLKVKAEEKPYISSKDYTKAYDRTKAVAYADQYYHERNPKWYNFTDEGGNCQNYASQCMLEGGIEMDFKGDEQWKCYIEDPEWDPEINEDETAYGRTRSWVNVNYFYNYAKWNEGKGMAAETNVNLYYAQPGDIIIVGNGGLAHTVIVSKIVDGHVLVNSNSIDMKDYPVEAYTYTTVMVIKILGSN